MSQKKETRSEKGSFVSSEIKNIIESITKEYGEGVITTLGESKLKEQKIYQQVVSCSTKQLGRGAMFVAKL